MDVDWQKRGPNIVMVRYALYNIGVEGYCDVYQVLLLVDLLLTLDDTWSTKYNLSGMAFQTADQLDQLKNSIVAI